jgi:urocanate hydratase
MPHSLSIRLPESLPPKPEFDPKYRRAPSRGYDLSPSETITAIKNALRYIPLRLHEQIAPEFLEELMTRGRIYGYRYRPPGAIKARPVDEYQGILEARAIQLMIDNNLDFDVALYPYELVTYGESGQVCQNWMQYPVGLFPSHRNAPRVISTNGLMVGMFDTPADFHKASALGTVNYGLM